MTTKANRFDCVEMMHKGGERVQALLQGMSREEQLAFWRKRTQEMRERQAAARQQQKAA